MFIRFYDSNQKYICKIEKEENDIRVIFYEDYEQNTSGFRIYSDEGRLLGNYPNHIVIKESYADGFLFSTEEGEKEEVEEKKTLGEKLEEANRKIENLEEALDCTNNAIEELLFNYILKEEESTEENE